MFSDIPPTMAPKNAPIPVVSPDRSVNITAFVLDIPPFFIGTDIDIPSGWYKNRLLWFLFLTNLILN